MSTVTRENIGRLTDKIIVKVEKTDYLPSFEKALKEYGKKANIPGFRKGMVPAGLIKKMYGNSVFADEVLKSVEKNLTDYMVNEKLDIFAQPLPLPDNDPRSLDMASPGDYSFAFEVGLKPDFSLPELDSLHPTRYQILVTDEMVDAEVERQQTKNGKMTDPETVTSDDNVLNVTFVPADADGNPAGEAAPKNNSLLVKYFSESFRPQLMGKKAGDEFVFQLATAFGDRERDWLYHDLGLSKDSPEDAEKFFKMTIGKVGLVEKAALDEELFAKVFPGQAIADAAAFREAVKAEIARQWEAQTQNHLRHTLYHELLDHTRIEFPEEFLKRWLQNGGDKQKTPDEVEAEFPSFANALKWTLITDKISRENNIQVQQEDIREAARRQIMSYLGAMPNAAEQPWMEEYVNKMMHDRKFVEDTFENLKTEKLLAWVEQQVKPVQKDIGVDDFHHLQEEHQHHHH